MVSMVYSDSGEPQPLHQMLTINTGCCFNCCFNYIGRLGLTLSARDPVCLRLY